MGPLPAPRLDADIVSPGLVDLQVNGAFGLEVGGDPGALRALAAQLPSTGVTTFLPTAVSSGAADYRALGGGVRGARGTPGRAHARACTSKGRCWRRRGRALIAPTAIAAAEATLDDAMDELLAAGAVRLVTLAPERPGALALITGCAQAGVVVSIGHTDATFEQAVAAIDAGATLVTHLYNAMSPLHHRAPGVVGAALADDRADRHVDRRRRPRASRRAQRRAAQQGPRADRCSSPTRSPRRARRPAATRSAGVEVISDGQTARLADGTLAGSTLTLDRAVRVMAGLGGRAPRGRARDGEHRARVRRSASPTPAASPSARPPTALWSSNMEVTATIVGGALAYRRP